MYETYFNLSERPFASVPRADHYYPAGVIDAARNTLTRCVDRGEGVGLIVGPSGSGKSLLCQVLADHFQKTFQVALLASTHLDTRRSLLQAMLYELNRPYRGMDEGELRLSLVDYITLSDDCPAGALLIVDESHHLPLRLLDEIRALTNLTRAMQPAVRLVLAGNHVLEERFASPKLESFSQRISARCYLEAFHREETQAYIWARILVCGGRGSDIFPVESCRMVHKATGGVPRLINQVCDHVMLMAYAASVRRIESAHVEEAWADLQQLPTPWSAPAEAAKGSSVIEFGGLDDEPAEMSPIAGRISGEYSDFPFGENGTVSLHARGNDAAAVSVAESPAAVGELSIEEETSRQLRHIRELLDDVQAEFQPAASDGPEIELIFDAPHPFAEPFAEEEVIADRYAAAAPTPQQTVQPSMQPAATNREAIRGPHELHRADAPAEIAAEDDHPAPPARSVVPPPRGELGRLFAGMRKGL
jgi:type II secretory pathway predicted ATPase ExeA